MPDPFYCCNRITDPQYFVGRQAELARIFTALETAHAGQLQSVSIVGPRRTGRSSLLYHLTQSYPQRLQQPERYVFCCVDLLSGRYMTRHALLQGLLAGLCQALPPSARRLEAQWQEAGRQQDLTLDAFEEAIRLAAGQEGFYPVLCLDEFEQLVKYPEAFPRQLFDSWRSLINGGQAAFVITSTRPLYELAEEEKVTSPFFNIFSEFIPLGELTEAEAYRLVERGRHCDRPFNDEDIQRALKWAGRHPLKLQQAGRAIYNAKQQPAANWRRVHRAYQATLRQTFGRRTRREQAGRFLRHLPDHVGRLALFWKGEAATDPLTRRTVGWALLLLLVVIFLLMMFSPGFRGLVATRFLPTPPLTPTP
ncbi:MAG: ATP-binding protein [Chloroflexi bacterium]|nr:ATP-binding protein [Chloroflexota bacterium]MCI0576526.1 ATP-binding protein [Chloroflexota bacterium]MCI0649841.1 ATP-binding protein [Chloroflexota bacterium]MCI0725120.1 ATP-binding protein [Chloroflexota bacterium]